jgi:hypothetical protein
MPLPPVKGCRQTFGGCIWAVVGSKATCALPSPGMRASSCGFAAGIWEEDQQGGPREAQVVRHKNEPRLSSWLVFTLLTSLLPTDHPSSQHDVHRRRSERHIDQARHCQPHDHMKSPTPAYDKTEGPTTWQRAHTMRHGAQFLQQRDEGPNNAAQDPTMWHTAQRRRLRPNDDTYRPTTMCRTQQHGVWPKNDTYSPTMMQTAER